MKMRRNKKGRFVGKARGSRKARRHNPIKRVARARRSRRANPIRRYRRGFRRHNPISRLGLGGLGRGLLPIGVAVVGFQVVERGTPRLVGMLPGAAAGFLTTPIGTVVSQGLVAWGGGKLLEMLPMTRPFAGHFMTGGLVRAGKSLFDMMLGAAPVALPSGGTAPAPRIGGYEGTDNLNNWLGQGEDESMGASDAEPVGSSPDIFG